MRHSILGKVLCRMILFFGIVGFTATGRHVGAEAVYIIPPAADNGAVLMYKSVHHSGEKITKPSCDPSMTPKIFVTPVRMLGRVSGDTIAPIAGISAYATDNNDGSWIVKGEVKIVGSNIIEAREAIAMIVELYCCAKGSWD